MRAHSLLLYSLLEEHDIGADILLALFELGFFFAPVLFADLCYRVEEDDCCHRLGHEREQFRVEACVVYT